MGGLLTDELVMLILTIFSNTTLVRNLQGHNERERERNVLFNTFYTRLYGVRHMVKDHSDSDIGYSYQLTARVLFYAPSHRQDNTYHGLCYTSRGALAGTRNSSMGDHNEGRKEGRKCFI